MNLIRTIIFAIVMFLFLWVPYSMIANQERILTDGVSFRFIPLPIDPTDPFRGKYVTLYYRDRSVNMPDAKTHFNRGDLVFAQLKTDTDGYAYIWELSKEKPTHPNYMKATVQYTRNDRVLIKFPENLTKYYMNEELAPKAEKIYRDLRWNNRRDTIQDSIKVYIDVRVLDGEAVIEEFYMDDLPIVDYIKSLDKKND